MTTLLDYEDLADQRVWRFVAENFVTLGQFKDICGGPVMEMGIKDKLTDDKC